MTNFTIKTIALAKTDPKWDRVAIVTLFTEKVKWEGSREQAEKMMKYLEK
jgi:hypothetical protein